MLGCVALPWTGLLSDLAMASARGGQPGEPDRDDWACQLQRSTARRPCTHHPYLDNLRKCMFPWASAILSCHPELAKLSYEQERSGA